mgnify:CR=1 FL=1
MCIRDSFWKRSFDAETTTTSSLIDSILKANDKGKIKIKKIDDNTSSKVEILIYLPSGISPDKIPMFLFHFL